MHYKEIGGSRSSFAACGVASVEVVAPRSLRKKLVLVNDSVLIIYILKGDGNAVVGSGIRLNPEGGFAVFEPDVYGYIWRGRVAAIASGAGANLAWQEDW